MKLIICSLSLLGVITIKAQNLSVSPYSAYALGDQLFDNNTEQGAMAGISTVPTNPFGQTVNFSNPAANQNLNLTNFNFSGSGANYNLRSASEKQTVGKFSVSNISIAFPVGTKGSFGLGFQPYTGLGYNTISTSNSNISETNQVKANGGLNSIHAFYSRNLTKEISLALRINYLFGELSRHEIATTDGAALTVDYSNKSNYRGLQFTLGSLYTKKIGNKHNINIGVTYTAGTNLRTDYTDLTTTYATLGNSQTSLDTITNYRNSNAKTKLPHTLAFATSYSKDNAWSIALEAKYSTWSNFSQPHSFHNIVSNNLEYKNTIRLALGGYWVPKFNSYKSYFDRVIYRGGIYYQSAQFSIYGTNIDSYGASVGVGLPVGRQNNGSIMNIALEYRGRGKTNNNLIKESYFGMKIGFDINDIWFRKRVID